MAKHAVEVGVAGPWSLGTSRTFWERRTPVGPAAPAGPDDALRTAFCADADWRNVDVEVTQHGDVARIVVSGDGDLDAAAAQVCRFLSLDVDGRGWPGVVARDPVLGGVVARWPGLRPCGFHSPYEAAVWAVLSQRTGHPQAIALRERLIADHGDAGAFPAPQRLVHLDVELPWRKSDYLRAVAAAALEGLLDGARLRGLAPDDAVRQVQEVKGLGPFSAELVVIRGANHPDALPTQEPRVRAEIAERYGPGRDPAEVADGWRPYRTWAAVHLRVLRGERLAAPGGRGHFTDPARASQRAGAL
jgi:DNA-3-methyladenine glycosylase II